MSKNEVSYTIKELIYDIKDDIKELHEKFDKVQKRMVCKSDCIRRRSTVRGMIIGCFGLLLSLLGGLAGYVFYK